MSEINTDHNEHRILTTVIYYAKTVSKRYYSYFICYSVFYLAGHLYRVYLYENASRHFCNKHVKFIFP